MVRSTRRRGTGGVYQRGDGKWVAVLEQPRQGDGRRRRVYLYAATAKEVEAKLRKEITRAQSGEVRPDGRITVATYLDGWLDASATRLKSSTLTQYRQTVRRYIVPEIGRVHLSKLTPDHLQALDKKLREGAPERGQAPLAPSTRLYAFRVLQRALRDAERQGKVARNVARLVDAPRAERHDAEAFTVEEAQRFLAAVQSDRYALVYILGLTTGLRRGELLALKWEDVDFAAGTIAVRRSLVKDSDDDGTHARWVVAEPKTRSSRRVVKVPAFALDALADLRTDAPARPLPKAYIFATSNGTIPDPRNVLREFKTILERAGLPSHFTIRSLRHSAATLMLAMGIHPKVVMEALGHSRITVTMDVYSHVMPHLQEEAAEKLDRLLSVPAI